ncbi:hypothetical protein PBY51_018234 [Eleginops maclovinus]|uniref:Uncharacterized protein n=1 Tax=Eleginops maclovinus TaxID=56733 RepID=A0AAN7XKX8_ELEMC|nr:hypothetical protein PBY51_018234 [Eleginops maclovinus]
MPPLSGCSVKGEKNRTPSAGPSEDIQLFCSSTLWQPESDQRARRQAEAVAPRQQLSSHGHQGGTKQDVFVCVRRTEYYVSCSSSPWLAYPICSARLSVPNNAKPGGTFPSDSISYMSA